VTSAPDVLAAISDTAEAILRDAATDSTLRDWDAERWSRLTDAGLAMVGTPESLGGSGGGPAEAAVVIRAVGAAAAPVPIVGSTLLLGWLSELTGHRPGAGGSAIALASTATDGSGRRVCHHVPWGRHAGWLLAVEADERIAPPLARVVPAERVTCASGANLAGEPRDELSYLPEPGDTVLAVPAGTADQLLELDALGRALLTAGAAESVMDLLTRYTSERVQFGRPLARQQAVQQMLAQAAGATCAVVAAADAATEALDRRGPGSATSIAVAAAKIAAADSADRLARLAHQVVGAIGLTQEYRLGAFTLRLRSWSREAGDRDYWSARLGAAAAGMDGRALWEAITATSPVSARLDDATGRREGEA
jgi:acyl-CoA dehydrogenase